MEDFNQTHWRKMFERDDGQAQQQPRPAQAKANPLGGYDDGYQPPPEGSGGSATLSQADVTDEAAIALSLDASEYKPWVLQRGRSCPAMMLHLRRYESKSGLWQGWQISYPHLIAIEYTGDKMLSLDFGTRQFVIEGTGLTELARHLQQGTVLMVQEYSGAFWAEKTTPLVSNVRHVGLQSVSL